MIAAALVVGAASAVGAQVDAPSPPPAVWTASCVAPGANELVVFGRGWAAGSVALSVTDPAGNMVGGASATAADRAGGAVFQGRVPMVASGGPGELQVVATQGATTASYDITVSSPCSPSITAVVNGTSCAPPGRPVPLTVTVRGTPTSAFDTVVHHVDLYGPAETLDRTQPARADGEYAIPVTVANVPGRVVPVTVEARRPNGPFAIATTIIGLPPACDQPIPPTTAGPRTTAPPTTPPAAATTAPPTTAPAGSVPAGRSPFSPVPGVVGAVSLAVSPAVGRAGDATTVVGRGFAPSSTVVLRWRPGIGEWTVTAGGDGSFRTQVLVLPNDIEGSRVLEVVGGGGVAPVPFLVVPGSDQPAFGGIFVNA